MKEAKVKYEQLFEVNKMNEDAVLRTLVTVPDNDHRDRFLGNESSFSVTHGAGRHLFF